jgi:hypothetical protein
MKYIIPFRGGGMRVPMQSSSCSNKKEIFLNKELHKMSSIYVTFLRDKITYTNYSEWQAKTTLYTANTTVDKADTKSVPIKSLHVHVDMTLLSHIYHRNITSLQ